MAETNGTVLEGRKTIGMDMEPPYWVYLNGVPVAKHTSEREASELYNRLAGRDVGTAPAQSK